MTKNIGYLFIMFVLCSCGEESINPDDFSDLSANNSAIDASGNSYEVGYEQVSSINQDPFVLKKNSDGKVLWKINHEETPVDGRAVLIAIDANDRIFVTFSVDGGSNENTYITKNHVENNAFSNAFMNSYGNGGGAKVSIVAEINPENGKIIRGTFITARLTNGKTNGLSIDKIGLNQNRVLLQTNSAAWPPGKGTNYQRYPDITDEDRIDGYFKINYVLDYQLEEILIAEIQ